MPVFIFYNIASTIDAFSHNIILVYNSHRYPQLETYYDFLPWIARLQINWHKITLSSGLCYEFVWKLSFHPNLNFSSPAFAKKLGNNRVYCSVYVSGKLLNSLSKQVVITPNTVATPIGTTCYLLFVVVSVEHLVIVLAKAITDKFNKGESHFSLYFIWFSWEIC